MVKKSDKDIIEEEYCTKYYGYDIYKATNLIELQEIYDHVMMYSKLSNQIKKKILIRIKKRIFNIDIDRELKRDLKKNYLIDL